MGLTSHLFTEQPESEPREPPQEEITPAQEATREEHKTSTPGPDEPTANRIGLNGLRSVSLSAANSRKRTRSTVPDVEVCFELGDLLPKIPEQFLKPGSHNIHQPIRFRAHHLLHGLSRGRPAATLSSIAGRCPGVFRGPIHYADDFDVQLPLQKILEQIGTLPRRLDQMPMAEFADDSAFASVAIEKQLPAEKADALPQEETFLPDSSAPLITASAPAMPAASIDPKAKNPEQEIRNILSAALQALPEKLAAGELKAEANSIRIDLPADVLQKLQAAQQDKPSEEPPHVSPVEEAGEEVAPLDPILTTPSPPDEPHPDTEQPEPPKPQTEPMSFFSKQTEKNQTPPPIFGAQPAMQLAETTTAQPEKSPQRGISLTRHDLNHDQILESITGLSGVNACIITSKNRLTLTGEVPGDFDIQKFRHSAPDLMKSLSDFAGPVRLGKVNNATLQCDSQLATFAGQDDVCLCIFHESQNFLPGLREKLDAVFQGSAV